MDFGEILKRQSSSLSEFDRNIVVNHFEKRRNMTRNWMCWKQFYEEEVVKCCANIN
jgi:hypothetical protein